MKRLAILVSVLALSSTPLLARIGDTQTVVEQSLGKGDPSDDEAPFKVPSACTFRVYSKGDIWCCVYFLQGKSVCECYTKSAHAIFSKVELNGFLAANAGGKIWTEIAGGSVTSWHTEDKSLSASYPLGSYNLLVIRTPSFDQLTTREADTQDRQRVGDFFAAATPTPQPSAPRVWPESAFKTPQPPYPAQARMSHIQGASTARVVFNSNGRVASVTIVKSAGSAILDLNTETYAKTNWSGPPNTTKDVPCVYRFQ